MPETETDNIIEGLEYEDVYSQAECYGVERLRSEGYPDFPDNPYEIPQKQLINNLVKNVIEVDQVKRQNLIDRIDEHVQNLQSSANETNAEDAQITSIKTNLSALQFYKSQLEANLLNESGQKLDPNKQPTMKDRLIVLSDTHGDVLSLLGSIIASGAVTVTPGEYVFADLTDRQIYDNLQDLPNYSNPNKQKDILILPRFEVNQNFQGEIIHLGDYIDRGPEGKLSLMIVYYLKKLLGNKFHALPGNHEISANSDDGAKRYHDILKLFYDQNIFEPSVMLEVPNEDPSQDKQYVCFSHCQLTKDSLPMLFRYASSFVGGEYQNQNEDTKKFGDAFLQILEQYSNLKEKLTAFYENKKQFLEESGYSDVINEISSVKKSLASERNRQKKEELEKKLSELQNQLQAICGKIYGILKDNNFSDFEMFQLRDVFIKTQIEMYKDRANANPRSSIESKVVASPFSNLYGQSPAGAEFIASRFEPNENNIFPLIKQVVGHTAKAIAEMIQNIIFIDNKRHSLYPLTDRESQTDFRSIISNFIFDKNTGRLLYNDDFSVRRDKKNFILENPSVEQLDKNYEGEEYRKNGLTSDYEERALTSLNKTLSSVWNYKDELERNKNDKENKEEQKTDVLEQTENAEEPQTNLETNVPEEENINEKQTTVNTSNESAKENKISPELITQIKNGISQIKNDLETEKQSVTDKVAEIINEARETLEVHKQKFTEQQKQLEAQAKELMQKEKDLLAQTNTLEQNKIEFENLKQEFEQQKTEISDSQEEEFKKRSLELDEQQKALDEQKSTFENDLNKFEKQKQELEEKQAELDALKESLAEQEEQLNQKETDFSAQQEAWNKQNEKIKEIENQIDAIAQISNEKSGNEQFSAELKKVKNLLSSEFGNLPNVQKQLECLINDDIDATAKLIPIPMNLEKEESQEERLILFERLLVIIKQIKFIRTETIEIMRQQEDLDKRAKQIKSDKQALEKQKKELDKSQKELEASKKFIQEMNQKAENISSELDEKEIELAEREKTVTAKEAELSKKENTLKSSQSKLKKQQNALKQKEGELNTLQEELTAKQTELEQRDEELQNQQNALEQGKKKQSKQANKLESKRRNFEQQKQEFDQNQIEFEKEKTKLEEQKDNLVEERQNFDQEVSKFQSEKANFEKQNQSLEQKKTEIDEQRKQSNKEKSELEHSKTQLNEEKQNLERQKSEVTKREKELQQKESEIENSNSQLENRKQTLDEKENALSERETNLNQLQEKLEQQQKNINNQSQKPERKQLSLNSTEGNFEQYEMTNETSQNKLSEQANENKSNLIKGIVSIALGTFISVAAVFATVAIAPVAICAFALGIPLLIYGSVKAHKTINKITDDGRKNDVEPKGDSGASMNLESPFIDKNQLNTRSQGINGTKPPSEIITTKTLQQ